MKKIGLIFAEEKEIEAFKNKIEITEENKIYNLTFYKGIINNIECILVLCGIGKVNAARTTQILIDNYQIDYVINAGVAGGLDNTLNIGDIIIGTNLVQHDFNLIGFGKERGEIPDIGKYIQSNEKLLNIAKSLKDNYTFRIKEGTIASGDIFCTEESMSTKINKEFNALACEMEGAAVAQVAYLANIPFLIIRSISDIPNGNNKIDFDTFLASSSKNVANLLLDIIKKI